MATKGRIKIAVVIPKYGLVGGGERFVSELTERVALKEDYEIHVFANRWVARSGRVRFHKVPIIRFPKFLTTVSFAYFVNKATEQARFDLIHTHDRIFRADLFTMHGIPHAIWVKEVRKKRMSLFDRATAWVEGRLVRNGGCSQFLSVSSLTREKFLEAYKVDPGAVKVIHPGVDMEAFDKFERQECRRRIRARFGLDESDFVILFVSMNFELKGLDILMAAMGGTGREGGGGNIKLLVIGKGNEHKFGQVARRFGLEGHVVFGGVWENNIQEVYLACDLFCMLSKFDTFGMTVLEAMAASLPVIISNRVGAKDLVQDGVNGFVVDRDDIEAVSSRIRVIFDPGKREAMRREARQTALAHTWDAVVKKVLEVYKERLSDPITMKEETT